MTFSLYTKYKLNYIVNEAFMDSDSQKKISFPKLLSEFELTNYDDWVIEAESSMKGKTVDKLFSKLYEDIIVKPIYTKNDISHLGYTINEFPGFYPFRRDFNYSGKIKRNAQVSQVLKHYDLNELNSIIKNSVKYGVNAFSVHLDECSTVCEEPSLKNSKKIFKDGLQINSLSDIENLFKMVDFKNFSLYFKNVVNPSYLLCLLYAYGKKHSHFIDNINIAIEFDPYSFLAKYGYLPNNIEVNFNDLSKSIKYVNEKNLKLKLICADSSIYMESGANAVQQLAYTIATAVEYIKGLIDNHSIEEISKRFIMNFAIGPNFFVEVAKFRAARYLWAKIIKEFGGDTNSQKSFIKANTSLKNKSKLDVYVNMLRNTT